MNHVVILTGDTIRKKLAGPAIRSMEIARALSAQHKVTLACPRIIDHPADAELGFAEYGDAVTYHFLQTFDVAFAPCSLLLPGKIPIPIAVDLYDPFILSNLHLLIERESMNEKRYDLEFEICIANLLHGDFFVCASERQRDFWLGVLAGLKRVNQFSYSIDPNLIPLIDILPFGISNTPPESAPVPPFPGASDADRWVVWAGGIWNWFDPLTLIRAIGSVSNRSPRIKLFFMGIRHPDPGIPEMKRARETIELAEQLELSGRNIFFGDWIPYENRGQYLSAAWVGVSTHHPHLETRFAFRTRILDYIWARIPVICTEGDSMADLIESERLGLTVPPENPDALAHALERLDSDQDFYRECRRNLNRIAPDFHWGKLVTPLATFCANPRIAPDKEQAASWVGLETEMLCAGNEKTSIPVGEITHNRQLEQLFVCRCEGLSRIDVKFATYARQNSGSIFVSLDDAAEDINLFRFPLNTAEIEDNAWHSFRFGPIPESRGKTFRLRIDSKTSRPGNAVTVWADDAAGSGYYFGNRKYTGSIAFRIYCRDIPTDSQLSDLFRRMFKRRFL